MAKVSQFSLWAMPAEGSPLRARLQEIISELSQKFSCPAFEPHVTVLGGFGTGQGLSDDEVIYKTKALCKALRPYTCHMLDLSRGSVYFQCVYLLIEKNHGVRLTFISRRSCSPVARETRVVKEGYMPHLSLLYGDLSDEQKGEAMEIVRTKYADVLVNSEFLVSSLALYRTDGEDKLLASWEKVGEYALEAEGLE
eukprot:jgi/Mesen1/4897/ME000244S04086